MTETGASTLPAVLCSGSSMKHSLCVVIPLYKQLEAIAGTLREVEAQGLPCFVIDDGNEASVRERLIGIVAQRSNTYLHSLPSNQGKGGAVIAGLRLAREQGFTHALQVDADGQHDLTELPVFWELSRKNPDALVAGQPVYDASANRLRVVARHLTHFLVKIQTLCLTAPDTMCGYRVYPLESTCALLERVNVGRRMDFDIEIMVRLIWEGVPIVKQYTKVIYPEGGQSNFNYLHDNILISKMHAKLVLGMLARFPGRLVRDRRRSSDSRHWAELEELGFTWGIRFLVWSYRLFGPNVFKAMLWPVIAYYFTCNTRARLASADYLKRVYLSGSSHPDLAVKPNWRTGFKHFLQFGYSNLDRLASWFGTAKLTDLDFVQKEEFFRFYSEGRGALLISSHLGNIEMCRALITQYPNIKFHVIMHTGHAAMINSVLKEINEQADLRVIEVANIGPETATFLKERVDAGEYVVILGDRTPVHSEGRISAVEFLGGTTYFPQGPYLLGHLLGCPVFTMFCLKESGRYRLYIEKFAERIRLSRKTRESDLQSWAQAYADILEQYCLREPLQWFNFYDFWAKDAPVAVADELDEVKAS